MKRLIIAALTTVTALPAAAHEFWLRPVAFLVEANGLVGVRTFNGERFSGDALPRNNAHIARFELLAPDGSATRVLGSHGAPMNLTRVARPGAYRLVYESVENQLALEAPKFEAYLEEEGLSHIIAERATLGESAAPGREVYVRCAKALLTAGDQPGATPADEPAGLPLEIVLGMHQDGLLTAAVLFAGEPIEGLRVVAVREGDAANLVELRSGPNGMVEFTPGAPGAWMLTTIHMERLENRPDADWKSYWATTTFELGRSTSD